MKATIVWKAGPATTVVADDVRETADGTVTFYDAIGRTQQIVNLRSIRWVTLEEDE